MQGYKPSICIIAQNAYGSLRGGMRGHIGGAERQTSMMARWLAARGYRICLVVWDEGQPDMEIIDGVTVVKLCRSEAGIRGLRFLHPRTTSLFSAMNRANASVYYQNSAEFVTGLAALWCRRKNRRFIYSVASDVACETSLPALTAGHERMLYRYGLRHADKIITQTRRQRELLGKSFGLDAVVLPMPCQFSGMREATEESPPSPVRVAWVGRLDKMKRLEWLLDVAREMPDIQFDVIAANMDLALRHPNLAEYARLLQTRAKSIVNVAWHGTVAREQVADIYKRALCLCCTSLYEGFPNTFLEAWSHGRPVVSSFDPDGLIQSRGLGTYATTTAEFTSAIRHLAGAPGAWQEQSRRCRDYFFSTHALDVAMPRFEREFVAAWWDGFVGEPSVPKPGFSP